MKLDNIAAIQSSDPVKQVLELTCLLCNEVLCDIEHMDTLDVLQGIAEQHTCKEAVEEE